MGEIGTQSGFIVSQSKRLSSVVERFPLKCPEPVAGKLSERRPYKCLSHIRWNPFDQKPAHRYNPRAARSHIILICAERGWRTGKPGGLEPHYENKPALACRHRTRTRRLHGVPFHRQCGCRHHLERSHRHLRHPRCQHHRHLRRRLPFWQPGRPLRHRQRRHLRPVWHSAQTAPVSPWITSPLPPLPPPWAASPSASRPTPPSPASIPATRHSSPPS